MRVFLFIISQIIGWSATVSLLLTSYVLAIAHTINWLGVIKEANLRFPLIKLGFTVAPADFRQWALILLGLAVAIILLNVWDAFRFFRKQRTSVAGANP